MASVARADRPQAPAAGKSQSTAPVAWIPARDLDLNQWAAAGQRIGAVGRCVQWLLGDWIVYGNEKFGERYGRVSKITGYDTQTLMNMVYVASRFEISRRRENLSWSHHEALAALDPSVQDYWLDQAAELRWSVADLRMMVRMSRKREEEGSGKVADHSDRLPSPAASMVKCPRCGEEVPVQ